MIIIILILTIITVKLTIILNSNNNNHLETELTELTIMCYKIIHCYVALELSDFFVPSNNSRNRGHNFKLFKK